jgi:hypothetical protein
LSSASNINAAIQAATHYFPTTSKHEMIMCVRDSTHDVATGARVRGGSSMRGFCLSPDEAHQANVNVHEEARE